MSGVTSEHPAGVCEGREGGKVQVVINMERDGLSALLRENLQDPLWRISHCFGTATLLLPARLWVPGHRSPCEERRRFSEAVRRDGGLLPEAVKRGGSSEAVRRGRGCPALRGEEGVPQVVR